MSRAVSDELPFAGTPATQMLAKAIERATEDRRVSTRGIARELGYKSTVVISHMATGRVGIPLDRAAEIAGALGLDKREFFLAVLEQRHEGSLAVIGEDGAQSTNTSPFVHELELIAGIPLDHLPSAHKSVLREVVADGSPKRRWLDVSEVSVVALLRDRRPNLREKGLDPADLERLDTALARPKG